MAGEQSLSSDRSRKSRHVRYSPHPNFSMYPRNALPSPQCYLPPMYSQPPVYKQQRTPQPLPRTVERERSLCAVGLNINQWFLIKFCGKYPAYDLFCNEFEELEINSQPYVSSSVGPFFLKPTQTSRTIQSTNFAVKAHKIDGVDKWTYIACEGPTASSVYDFWNLIWQENIKGILMLNQPCEERRKPKNYDPAHETIQYWPVKPGEVRTFAPWKVECIDSKLKGQPGGETLYCSLDHESVVYRVSHLRVTEANPITQPAPREIVHVCHYKWIDCKIPQTPSTTHLVDMINKEFCDASSGLVVHCHAGVGRTGVAIVLHIAANRLNNHSLTDVRETVRAVRKQRPRSVMNRWQYAYCNVALAEMALRNACIEPTVVAMERTSKYLAPANRVSKQTTPQALIKECLKRINLDMNSFFVECAKQS